MYMASCTIDKLRNYSSGRQVTFIIMITSYIIYNYYNQGKGQGCVAFDFITNVWLAISIPYTIIIIMKNVTYNWASLKMTQNTSN